MYKKISALLILILVNTTAFASNLYEQDLKRLLEKFDSEREMVSYAIGASIAPFYMTTANRIVETTRLKIESDTVLEALEDSLNGKNAISPEEALIILGDITNEARAGNLDNLKRTDSNKYKQLSRRASYALGSTFSANVISTKKKLKKKSNIDLDIEAFKRGATERNKGRLLLFVDDVSKVLRYYLQL